MATEFAMPKLGLTMESGTILRWLVPDGTPVDTGQSVVLVETDKVETEIEASGSGVLAHSGEVGEEYACGVRIGWFLEPGESPPQVAAGPPGDASQPLGSSITGSAVTAAPAAAAAAVARAPGERVLASPAAKRLARELGVELGIIAGSGPNGRITERDVQAAFDAPPVPAPGETAPAATGDVQRLAVPSPGIPGPGIPGPGIPGPGIPVPPPATFAARQLADLLGVDLRAVHASSADGRISRADVASHVRTLLSRLSPTADAPAPELSGPVPGAAPIPATLEPKPAPADEAPPLAQTPTEQVPLRGMRGVIAERMTASLREMAQLTLTMDVDMSAVIAERAALVEIARSAGDDATGNPGGEAPDAAVPGYTDYVVAAAAAALRVYPRVNSQVTADAVALLGDIHVGLAVALDDGLLVPVVRHTDRLSPSEIATETKRLAGGARSGGLGYDDFQGATFTVTALGMFGVDAFTPVINPPNTAILGVGRIRTETDWSSGSPEARPVLTLSLTWDHRAFDGAPAARFTGAVRDWLESR
ncbi:2-oxo acid dehydrogenase subunit E2 [Candidatus Poriferisodalis sp.]|uniref:2-oxo acid dehydrogenase subunit E2 n=1 Tax=Candidatus Poriferisodalis sp. TaxID=3101277 RepID=UPI003D14EFAE